MWRRGGRVVLDPVGLSIAFLVSNGKSDLNSIIYRYISL